MQGGNIQSAIAQVGSIYKSINHAEAIYVLDGNGIQITDSISKNKKLNNKGKGDDKSNRACYYRVIQEHRCILTDPYPTLVNNTMIVTSSFPIYDEDDNLLCIICVDISLVNILRIVHPSSVDSNFGRLTKVVYGLFSVALAAISMLLFIKGVTSFLSFGTDLTHININEMFKSTILLTLSLAIFDLVKAIFEDEVLGKERYNKTGDSHQTMVKFLGSIIIALSIEALMLVFKFALTDPSKLEYAVYLIAGISLLLVSLSVYIRFNRVDTKDKTRN